MLRRTKHNPNLSEQTFTHLSKCIPLNPALIPRSAGEDIYTPPIAYPISALNNYIVEQALLSKSEHPIAYQKQCPITVLSTAHSMYLAPPILAL